LDKLFLAMLVGTNDPKLSQNTNVLQIWSKMA
jgi:hypothetical protein